MPHEAPSTPSSRRRPGRSTSLRLAMVEVAIFAATSDATIGKAPSARSRVSRPAPGRRLWGGERRHSGAKRL